jgi:hypothetical protein
VRRLNDGSIGLLEYGREQLHLKDDVRDAIDVDTVSHVVPVGEAKREGGPGERLAPLSRQSEAGERRTHA